MTNHATHTNDNTPRPATFDARLMAYRPAMRKLAIRHVPDQYREDLVSDTIVYSLTHWQSFREEGGFYNWIKWNMWSVVRKQALSAMRRKGMVMVEEGETYINAATPAAQQDHAELSAVLGQLSGTRNGNVVLRRAMGDTLRDVANDLGLTTARIEQISRQERERLRKAVG